MKDGGGGRGGEGREKAIRIIYATAYRERETDEGQGAAARRGKEK